MFWKHSKASVLLANPDDRRFTTIDGMDRWNILLSPVLQIHGSQGPDNWEPPVFIKNSLKSE